MFDLEQSIAEWRKQMLDAGIKTPVPLEELEIHLLEEIERQRNAGLDEQEVFDSAVRQIGQASVLESEFTKVGGTIQELVKHFMLTLSGVPNSQLATNMNASNSNIEPRWATYFKATAFLAPAALLWIFSAIFLLPKLNQICQTAGTTAFDFSETAPAIFKAFAMIGQLMVFLTAHWILFSCMVILVFILLEWRSDRWPRYRRAAVGVGIFLFNFAVLLSITLMVTSALIHPVQLNAKLQSGRNATSDEVRNISAEEWFDRIGQKEIALGYAPNVSLNTLIQKATESDASKDDIIRRAENIIDDPQQNSFKRWQSCYVLSGIGDKRGIPAITRAFGNQDPVVRGVAACALGAFDDPDAKAALEKAAKNEKNPDVQNWIQTALDGKFLPER